MPLATAMHEERIYSLYAQRAHGEINVADPFKDATFKINFRRYDAPHAFPPSEGQIQIAVMYTSEKEEKIAPLREALDKHFNNELSKGWVIKTDSFKFSIKNTGVGEQPYHPEGIKGAHDRIIYVQDLLEGKEKEWDQEFPKPNTRYDLIFIASVESDIFLGSKFAYDKPNIIIYECVTGQLVAGTGRGPACQEDIVQLVQIMKEEGNETTYGKMLNQLFSGKAKSEGGGKIEFLASDWHGTVMGAELDTNVMRNRTWFIKELCQRLDNDLVKMFTHIFQK